MPTPVVETNLSESPRRSLLWAASWSTLYIGVSFLQKIIRGLIVPVLLAPAAYGLWSSLSVVVGYMRYADLGVVHQLNKRLPFELSRRGSSGYWDLAGRGISWMLCVTLSVSVMLLIGSFLYQGSDAWFYRRALCLLAIVVIAQNFRILLTTLLETRQEFRIAAITVILTDISSLLLAVFGLLTIGLMGLVWALLISEIIGLLYCLYHLWHLGLPQMRWQLRGVTNLIREGLLLLGVALIEQIMMTVDLLFILIFFSKEQFGLYALGSFVVSIMISLVAIFLSAQPRILELWGSGQEEKSQRVVEATLALYILVGALSVAAFIPMSDLLVHFYLKDYKSGLTLYVLMPALALARGPVILLRAHFLAHNRERRLIAFQLSGLAMIVLLDGFIIWQGLGMIFIVLASTVGYLLSSVLMFVDFEKERRVSGRAKYAMLLASLVGVISLSLFFSLRDMQQSNARHIVETFGASVLYTALIAGVFWATRYSWLGNARLYLSGSRVIPLLKLKKDWLLSRRG